MVGFRNSYTINQTYTPDVLVIFTADCKDFFGRSLFFVGEFGINDYQYSFGKKSMQEIRAFVPDLIQIISLGAEARTLRL